MIRAAFARSCRGRSPILIYSCSSSLRLFTSRRPSPPSSSSTKELKDAYAELANSPPLVYASDVPSSSPPSSDTSSFSRPSPKRSHVMLFASEISVITGLNPWRSIPELFETIWQRTDPVSFQTAKTTVEKAERRKILSRVEELDSFVANTPVQTAMEAALPSVPALNTEQFAQVTQQVKEVIRHHIPADRQEAVIHHELGKLKRHVGVVNEAPAIQLFERVAKTKVVDSNKQYFSKKFGLCSYDPTMDIDLDNPYATEIMGVPIDDFHAQNSMFVREWSIGGKVDGFVNGQLMEIKNRTEKFFNPLPAYDRAQFETYLQILDLQEGELVEMIKRPGAPNPKSGDMNAILCVSEEFIKRTRIKRDDHVWNQVLIPRIERFVNFLHSFLLIPPKHTQYMKARKEAEKGIMLAKIIPTGYKSKK